MDQEVKSQGMSQVPLLSSGDVAEDMSHQKSTLYYPPGGEGNVKVNPTEIEAAKEDKPQTQWTGSPTSEPTNDKAKLCEIHRKQAEAAIQAKKEKKAIWNDPNSSFSDKATAGAGIVKEWFSEKRHEFQMGRVEKEKMEALKKSGGDTPPQTAISPSAGPITPVNSQSETDAPPSPSSPMKQSN